MSMLPRALSPKHTKGQDDHVDAWLISYADLITLLFTFFVIFVSITAAKQHAAAHTPIHSEGEERKHPYADGHYGMLVLKTPYDELYRNLVGIVALSGAEQNIAVEQTDRGVWIDMADSPLFERGTADISAQQMPLLKQIAHNLQLAPTQSYNIAVEGYTDDAAPENGKYANNWELAAMRATHVVNLLIAEGIAPSRLRATSYAGNHPLVPNTDALGHPIAENRNSNQRVVIKVERTVL